MSIRKLALTALTLLLTASLAAAKEKVPPPTPFEVVVTSPEGTPTADADVSMSCAAMEPPYSFAGKSDAAGKAQGAFPDMAHTYTLKVTKEGFRAFEQAIDLAAKKLRKGQTAEIKVQLLPMGAPDHYMAAVAAIQGKDLAKAQAELERAVAVDPSFEKGYSVLSMVHLEQKQWDAGLAAADRALALDATDKNALRSRYDALDGLGRETDAEAALATLAAQDRSPEIARILFNAGAAAWKKQEGERARVHFREAVAIDPKLYQAHNALAEISIAEKKWDDAVAELDQVIAITPRNFKAYERKIDVLLAAGDRAKADEVQKALDALKATPAP